MGMAIELDDWDIPADYKISDCCEENNSDQNSNGHPTSSVESH